MVRGICPSLDKMAKEMKKARNDREALTKIMELDRAIKLRLKEKDVER